MNGSVRVALLLLLLGPTYRSEAMTLTWCQALLQGAREIAQTKYPFTRSPEKRSYNSMRIWVEKVRAWNLGVHQALIDLQPQGTEPQDEMLTIALAQTEAVDRLALSTLDDLDRIRVSPLRRRAGFTRRMTRVLTDQDPYPDHIARHNAYCDAIGPLNREIENTSAAAIYLSDRQAMNRSTRGSE